MAEALRLDVSQLYRDCPTEEIGYNLSSEIAEPTAPLGQARALDAIQFGLEMRRDGFNLKRDP